MLSGLIILHVVVCILLSIVVLLQFGKGAEAGAMMGSGSSQAIFTSSAKGNFFTKMTTTLAILFMVTSISITVINTKDKDASQFDGDKPVASPLNSDQPAGINPENPANQKPVEEPQAKAAPAKTEAVKPVAKKADSTETKKAN